MSINWRFLPLVTKNETIQNFTNKKKRNNHFNKLKTHWFFYLFTNLFVKKNFQVSKFQDRTWETLGYFFHSQRISFKKEKPKYIIGLSECWTNRRLSQDNLLVKTKFYFFKQIYLYIFPVTPLKNVGLLIPRQIMDNLRYR